ncbi:MAG: sulfatase-like hydrolase/transferase [Bryobacterales bacterium]|nr:sulfatase-like hydrolase/transferase [Bryobacterales bacterium]
MADDQGWGDVGFRNHPVLKTPVLDELAATGLRFDRFYAAAPVCSPTRGSVMTGRHPNRFGCFSWGHTLRPEELTIAETLRDAGYATGHFGKWHLGEVRADSETSPGASGFEEWLSSPNFYENHPLMSHQGKVVETEGEGSQVAVDAAIQFIRQANQRNQPFLAVVWFGSPHAPHEALDDDRLPYAQEPEALQHFYGEITAMDRAIGNLRTALKTIGVAENTLLWYKSDNGALPVGSAGGLRGKKADLEEGGIRVPAMIEWPARIKSPRATSIPCSTVDIYPTLVDVAGATPSKPVLPLDGISLAALIDGRMERRDHGLGFWVYPEPGIRVASREILEELAKEQSGVTPQRSSAVLAKPGSKHYAEDERPGFAAWIDGDFKLHRKSVPDASATYSLYNLSADPQEQTDLAAQQPERLEAMKTSLEAWQASVVRSMNGLDY